MTLRDAWIFFVICFPIAKGFGKYFIKYLLQVLVENILREDKKL